ncbi:MAG TPA: hypothetical protein VJQ84_02040 [Solirubrobacterales bacterium]|nr:hypothetical protein [Solirubrobacterales bacterium]
MNHMHSDLVHAKLEDRAREADRLALFAEIRRVDALRQQAALAARQRPTPLRGWIRAASHG